jgi:DNA-binding LacI/PurR family transcriptional regulator
MSQTELARLAFEALMHNLQQEYTGGDGQREFVLDTRLVLRGSTAMAPADKGRIG